MSPVISPQMWLARVAFGGVISVYTQTHNNIKRGIVLVDADRVLRTVYSVRPSWDGALFSSNEILYERSTLF